MIKLMLRHPVQHVVEIVLLPGNAFAKPRFRQGCNGLHQYTVRFLRISHTLAPCGLGGTLWNKRKVRSAFGLPFLAGQPTASHCVPDRHVQNQLPNAVNIGQRLSRSRCSVNISQQLKQSGPMPRIALECAAKLLGDEKAIGA